MKKIIILIMLLAGSYQAGLLNFLQQSGSYDSEGNAKTLVFTHDRCGKPCNEAMSLLNNRRVQFTEYKLDGMKKI